MSRLADLATTAARPTGLPCSMGDALAHLETADPESAADLADWLAGEKPWSDDDVWRAVQALGLRVGRQTVGRHRRGTCRCGR